MITCPLAKRGFNLKLLLRKLGRQDCTHLLVEGGGETNAAFIEAGLASRVAFFYAPKILGGRDARTAVAVDGGQEIFEDFLLIGLTDIMSCPKLLRLADKTRKVDSNWDQHHRHLMFDDTKATNASPKQGI